MRAPLRVLTPLLCPEGRGAALHRLDTICWLALDKRSTPRVQHRLPQTQTAVQESKTHLLRPETFSIIYSPASPSLFSLVLLKLFLTFFNPVYSLPSSCVSSSLSCFPTYLCAPFILCLLSFLLKYLNCSHPSCQVGLFGCERLSLRRCPTSPAGSIHL